MGSQNGGGGGQQSQFQPLSRQSSLYNLTLDEVQNQFDLGKPVSSMNLEELLANVWTAEASQATGMDAENAASAVQHTSASALQRQTSLTLTGVLSKKTVDEVWRDIQQGQKKNNEEKKTQERQPTLGEMTLEDFLVKAGVVAEASSDKESSGPVTGFDPMVVAPQNFPQQAQWLQHQLPSVQQQHQQQQEQPQNPQPNMMGIYMSVPQALPMSGSTLLDVPYPENQFSISSPIMGTLSDTQTSGRKRVASGDVVEKTVERRQKRMIKNRESAARSRARKQVVILFFLFFEIHQRVFLSFLHGLKKYICPLIGIHE